MRNAFWKITLIATLAGGLAACGSDNAASPPSPAPVVPPPASKVEDGFGVNFGTAFRADANTNARDPAAGDIIPLDLTKNATTI